MLQKKKKIYKNNNNTLNIKKLKNLKNSSYTHYFKGFFLLKGDFKILFFDIFR